MKCPVCPDATLLMSERQGVEIDYCPTCRGIWLDRGELDKLLQMSASQQSQQQSQSETPRRPTDDGYRGDRSYPDSGKYHHSGGYRKRKSWLEEIFD
ncbi:MAG: zf-TFIIB domain-containing protein [Spongiibacteraceae bacterium]